jgi:hypothetical protein
VGRGRAWCASEEQENSSRSATDDVCGSSAHGVGGGMDDELGESRQGNAERMQASGRVTLSDNEC